MAERVLVKDVAGTGAAARLRKSRPEFFDVLDGEIFKVARQWTTWLLAAGVGVMLTGFYVVALTVPLLKQGLDLFPLAVLYRLMTNSLLVIRIFSGTFLIVVTARLIGMEYSGGTIRVLLGRGVGRLHLLGAKLLAIWGIALALLAAALVYNALLTCALLLIVDGNLSALSALDGPFWADTWLYLITILISMGVTILLAACVTVLARSFAAGLAVGLSFFAADNIGIIFFRLAYRLTGSRFWLDVTALLLGPNINATPAALLPASAGLEGDRATPAPLVAVDARHTLTVTLVYAAIFAATAVILTWRRDVNE